jgi:hypothetical protein
VACICNPFADNQFMRSRLDELEDVVDLHARRIAREFGGLLVGVGEALKRAAEPEVRQASHANTEPTRDDLYREATRLNVPGRSRMTKDELRDAVDRGRRAGA